MAGVKGRSGRKPKNLEQHQRTASIHAEIALVNYLERVSQMTGDELLNNPRAVDHCMQVYIKDRDIESKREVATISIAPLVELLDRASELNRTINVTPRGEMVNKIIAQSVE